jgi:peptide/nickel transport system permease protein
MTQRAARASTTAGWLGSRLLQAVSVLLGAYTLTFLIIHLLPSDPITNFLVQNGMALDAATVDAMKAYYGFDHPVYQQYFIQFFGILHGNPGYALSTGHPVLQDIGDVLPPTLRLAGTALALSLLIAFTVVTAANLIRPGRLQDAIVAVPPLLSAIPTFWLGMVLIRYLSFRLQVIPLFPDGSLVSLLVPAFVVAISLSAPLAQVMLKRLEAARRQPFVDVLRAKGAPETWIYFRHLLKYAAGGGITILGVQIGGLLGGAVVTETVFSRPGIGRILTDAVANQDIALVQAFVLLIAGLYVTVSLLIDLLYPLLDPRIRLTDERPQQLEAS